jgi:hypothetical protein
LAQETKKALRDIFSCSRFDNVSLLLDPFITAVLVGLAGGVIGFVLG